MMDQTTTGGNFSEADRTTLITLCRGYGLHEVRGDRLAARRALCALPTRSPTDVAKLWVAVEESVASSDGGFAARDRQRVVNRRVL